MNPAHERLRQLFRSLLARYAGAIEFWTVVCLSRGDLGDPADLIDAQWALFRQDIQDLREALAGLPVEPPPVVQDQVARLIGLAAELRDVFNVLLDHPTRARKDVEAAVLKLGALWQELRVRVALAAATVPLRAPLPAVTSEQEAYFQGILDGLFDRFTGAG